MADKDKYESYLDLDDEQRYLVQQLLLHQYALESKQNIGKMVTMMKEDLKLYEQTEMYDTCQLYVDSLKLIDNP